MPCWPDTRRWSHTYRKRKRLCHISGTVSFLLVFSQKVEKDRLMVLSIIPQREIVEELGTFKLVHGIRLLGIQATAEL